MTKASLFIASMLLNLCVQSEILNLRLRKGHQTGSSLLQSPRFENQAGEIPVSPHIRYHLGKLDGNKHDGTHSTPVQNWQYLLMLVDLSIGTPPQSFTTVVDLAWTDLFVPSSKCLERRCIEHHATYNASKSSTYVVNGTEIERHYAGMYTSGIISEDTVHLAGLEIKSQQFEEATQLHPVPGYWDFAYDGVLGLAPPKSGSAQNKLQPLSTMISHGLLDKNIFALKLPLDDSNDGDGELTVGSMNEDMFTGDMTKISLTEEIDPYLAGKWTVEARSVVLGGGKIVNKTLKGHAAFFDSGYPFIDLPLDLAREVIKAIGAKPTSSLFFVVPCKKRDELPNLKVNLGGFDVILTAYDYTTVMERDECAVWFDGHPGTKDEKPYLRLGSMFLKELYSIFDLDGRTIGFAKVKRDK